MHLEAADPALSTAVTAALERWTIGGSTARLLSRDASLWTSGDEARWLGWLEPAQSAESDRL